MEIQEFGHYVGPISGGSQLDVKLPVFVPGAARVPIAADGFECLAPHQNARGARNIGSEKAGRKGWTERHVGNGYRRRRSASPLIVRKLIAGEAQGSRREAIVARM